MGLTNPLFLFRDTKNEKVRVIRASTLCSYWYCAEKAFLQATKTVESEPNEATLIGTEIHDAVAVARPKTAEETELDTFLKQFMVDYYTGKGGTALSGCDSKVFMRAWLNWEGETVGYITTHGFDDFQVKPNKHVTLIEYKTTNQKQIDKYKLPMARFQVKLYMWILCPLLKLGGYSWDSGKVIFLNRKGEYLYGDEITDFSEAEAEAEIKRVFDAFNDNRNMYAPARFKCYRCPKEFKDHCIFQGNR